ncbi:MAG: nucleotide sugar dehydrogenase [Candidatus Thorarchaeota archaeon]
MSRYTDLLNKITRKEAKVAVIGLGYIGLPTSIFYAMRGIDVRGIDTNSELVASLKKGAIPIHEEGLGDLASEYLPKIQLQTTYDGVEESDVCVLCLPSPIDENGKPVIKFLENAVSDIAKRMKTGCLVLNESTVPVGTTQFLFELFSSVSQLDDNEIWFAHCPERVLPGKLVEEMDTNHRLAGGTSEEATTLAMAFLQSIFKPELIHPTSSGVSEAAKLAENAFRDVNISYANELAKLCTHMSIDVSEVITLANLHPRVSILNPGLGVGGYCLPKDGWILVESARAKGGDAELIPAARHVNDSMPAHIAKRIHDEVLTGKVRATVGLLGLAFKENVSDTRNSPTVVLLKTLTSSEIDVIVYDPLVSKSFGAKRADSIDDFLESSEIVVMCVGHNKILDELKSKDLSEKVFFDPRNMMSDLKSKVKKYIGLSV